MPQPTRRLTQKNLISYLDRARIAQLIHKGNTDKCQLSWISRQGKYKMRLMYISKLNTQWIKSKDSLQKSDSRSQQERERKIKGKPPHTASSIISKVCWFYQVSNESNLLSRNVIYQLLLQDRTSTRCESQRVHTQIFHDLMKSDTFRNKI